MRNIFVITSRELFSYFGSSLGYILAAIFVAISAGLTFYFGHFFDRGVLIELSSDALRAGEFDDESENRWEEFLKLCGHYRSQRPLDSILISVPAKVLLQAENNNEAKKNYRRQ